MSTEGENGAYRSRSVVLSKEAASAFRAEFIRSHSNRLQALDISGQCPCCHHFVHHVVHLREFAPDTELDDPEVQRRKPKSPSYRFALNCNCAETHASAGKDPVSGCGAWFNVEVEQQGKLAVLRPGSPGLSQYEMQNALLRDQLAASELQRARAAAGSWKTGLAALFVLIPTLVVVKGTDTVDNLAKTDKVVVGGLIAFGATLAVIAALIALRAAYGPVRRQKVVSDDNAIPRMTEVARTVTALQATRIVTVLASAALAAAISYAWAAPSAKAELSVDLANGTGYCGKLVGLQAGVIRIETSNGVTTPISTADVTSTTFVSSC